MEPAVELRDPALRVGVGSPPSAFDAHQARIEGGKHDVSVRPPRCAAPDGRGIADDNWSPARDRGALQLSVREEGDPLAVGGEEGEARAVAAVDDLGVELVEAAHIKTFSSVCAADVSEPSAVRRQGERPSRIRRVELDAGRQRDGGADRRCRGRAAARQRPRGRARNACGHDCSGRRELPARGATTAWRVSRVR